MCEKSDKEIVIDLLRQITEILERTHRSFSSVSQPDDFYTSDENRDKLDTVSMKLLVVGELLKRIDRMTNKLLFEKYDGIDWTGFMGLRDVIAHDYCNINPVRIFEICSHETEPLLNTVNQIITELEKNDAAP